MNVLAIMNVLAVNWLDVSTNVLLAAFVFVGLILIGIVLIQRGRGGGLASAFGGGGGNTAFGSKTGDVLTWATSVIFGLFLLLAVILNLLANKQTSNSSSLLPRVLPAPVMPTPATPAPATPDSSFPPATLPANTPATPNMAVPNMAPPAMPAPATQP